MGGSRRRQVGQVPFQQASSRWSSATSWKRAQAAARVGGRRRSSVRKAWATETSVTWWCQPGVAAPLEVVEAEDVFELAVVVLDAPAQLAPAGRSSASGVSGGSEDSQ